MFYFKHNDLIFYFPKALKGEGQSHGELVGDLGHPGLPLGWPHFLLCFHGEITSLAVAVSRDNGL